MMKKLEQFIEALTHPNNLSTYLQNHHYSQWDFNDMQFMFKFQSITNSHQAFASVLSDWLSHVRKTFLSVEEALKAKSNNLKIVHFKKYFFFACSFFHFY